MKTSTSILIFVITLLQTSVSLACTCYEYSFCGSIGDTTSVLQVIVLEKYSEFPNSPIDEYADVKIIETLQNEIIEDTITIAGVTLSGCHEALPAMEVGDTLVINLPELIFPYIDAQYPAFQLYSCEVYILKLSAGILTGNIQPDLSSMNYDDFVTNLGNCNDFINSTEDLFLLEKVISISPNPFSENINIDFGNLPTSKISIEIFSAQSQKITSSQNFQQYNYKFPMNDFPKGIYFVKIQYRNELMVKKIIKI